MLAVLPAGAGLADLELPQALSPSERPALCSPAAQPLLSPDSGELECKAVIWTQRGGPGELRNVEHPVQAQRVGGLRLQVNLQLRGGGEELELPLPDLRYFLNLTEQQALDPRS